MIDFNSLSFRETVSSFFRIYGKDNIDERKPLRGLRGKNMQKSIVILIKLFDRYKDIESYNSRLEEQKKKLSAFREARKYRFVPDLVGGKKQYEENVARINELQVELDNLSSQQIDSYTEADIQNSLLKAQLQGNKLRLESELQSKQRRLSLIDISLEYGLYPTEADLAALQDFFPQVNIRRLYEVEQYHKKLAVILDEQFTDERQAIQNDIMALQEQIRMLKIQIKQLGLAGNLSKEFLDKHSEIKGQINALKAQNDAYLTLTDLQDAQKKAADALKKAIESILFDIQKTINSKMKEFNDTLYSHFHKPPQLIFNAYDSYSFETPSDSGTGTNYKGLVLYDLAVLFTTALPALAHDSLILKNIGNNSVDGIMKIYVQSQKQIFIAFDKLTAYTLDTQRILRENTVLHLFDNGGELYGRSWSGEVSQNEDGL